MIPKLTLNYLKPDLAMVYIDGVHIGDFYKEVDGYFIFSPIQNGSSWNEWILRLLADKLYELNLEWDKNVTEYFSNNENNITPPSNSR